MALIWIKGRCQAGMLEVRHYPLRGVTKSPPSVVHIGLAVSLTRFLQLGPDRQLLGIVSREDVMRALKEATQGAQ
jgi:hypothetical protein